MVPIGVAASTDSFFTSELTAAVGNAGIGRGEEGTGVDSFSIVSKAAIVSASRWTLTATSSRTMSATAMSSKGRSAVGSGRVTRVSSMRPRAEAAPTSRANVVALAVGAGASETTRSTGGATTSQVFLETIDIDGDGGGRAGLEKKREEICGRFWGSAGRECKKV